MVTLLSDISLITYNLKNSIYGNLQNTMETLIINNFKFSFQFKTSLKLTNPI